MNPIALIALALASGALATHLIQSRFGLVARRVQSVPLATRVRIWLRDRAEAGERGGLSSQLTETVSHMAPITAEAEAAQREALLRSGMKMSANAFWAARFICIAVCVIIASVMVSSAPEGSVSAIPMLLLGAAVGYAIPQLYLLETRRQWREDIERELPNALDLMAVTVSAGSTFDAAIRTVAENSEGALADGFRDVLAQSRFMDVSEALKRFADHANVQPLTIFVASLSQARAQGLSISEILTLQADTVRQYRRARLEEEVNKLPVKIIFPIIFFIFPALFGVVLVPAGMQLLASLGSM